MNNAKKLLSLLLVFALVCSFIPSAALADVPEGKAYVEISPVIDEGSLIPGNTITANVVLHSGNTAITVVAFELYIDIDSSKVSLEEQGSGFSKTYFSVAGDSPVSVWSGDTNLVSGEDHYLAVARATNNEDAYIVMEPNAEFTLGSLVFKVKEDASFGPANFGLVQDFGESNKKNIITLDGNENIDADFTTVNTVNVAEPNSIVITGDDTIAAPEALANEAQETTVQYKAVVIDESGNISDQSVTWSISGNDDNVTIDSSSGKVTVKSGAAAGEYTITATATVEGDELVGKKTIEVTKNDPVAKSITLTGSTNPITVPGNNEEDATATFTATVTDQYGDTMTNPVVTWSLSEDITGISIAGGVLTVTNAAKAGITDTTGKTLTVTATCGEKSDTATVTVKRAASTHSSIEILKGDKAITSDNIAAGETGNYTAKYYDQYGYEMEPPPGATPNWSMSEFKNCAYSDFALEIAGKDAIVKVDDSVENGASATLTVTEENLTDSITINVDALTFTAEPDAVTFYYNDGETRYYGPTWGELVQIHQTKITATFQGEEVKGTYYIKVARGMDIYSGSYEVPNLNERPVCGLSETDSLYGYAVYFDSEDETFKDIYVAKYMEEYSDANIELQFTLYPKPVTVSGITATDKVYDGTTVATIDCTYATVNEADIVDGDEVTIDATGATGTFEDKNVGTDKTVTITDLTLSGEDAANYTLSTPVTTTADITAKELTADVSGVSVTKEYDGTTAAGEVSGSATADTGISGETVDVDVTAGEYDDKNVGDGKSVTLTLSLSGEGSSNYELTNKTQEINNAVITAKDVSETGEDFSQNVVVGDGTFTEPTFTGVNGETVTGTVKYSYNNSEMTKTAIETELAKLEKDATATIGYTFTASDNYMGTITGEINVTMVDIVFTVGGAPASADNAVDIKDNPTYGDTWSAIVTIKENDIVATLDGDTLSGGTYSLNVSGMPDAGAQAYIVQYTKDGKTYDVCSGAVNVAQKKLTITGLSAEDKTYNGNTNAVVTGTPKLEGVLQGDSVTVTTGTAAFARKDAGPQTVTFSGYGIEGTSASNYVLSAQPVPVTATISPKPVTIENVAVSDKPYNGSTSADITDSGSIVDLVPNDTVTIVQGTGTFASADVGTGITVTFSGFSLTGADSSNYTLSAQPASTTADITKGTYTGTPNTVNVNILINQSAAQTGSASLDQFFQAVPAGAVITSVAPASGSVMASVSVADGVISYSSKANLETEGVTDTYTVTIETKNYNDITATLIFTTIAKTPVNITGVSVTGAGKTYDGRAVSYAGTPVAKTNDGTEVTVTGTYSYVWQTADGTALSAAPKDAGSYKLVITLNDTAYLGSAEVSFTISKAQVTITANDAEAYTGSDMPKLSYTVTGLASGESLAVEPTLSCAADMKKAASYEIKVSGAAVPDTGNYVEAITYVSGVLTVKDRPINIGPVYDITVLESDHGTVKASLSNASEGSTIRLTVTPDDGYSLYSITVRAENGKLIDVSKSGGVYSFKMPASAVTVQASFVKGTAKLPFNDVSENNWFYDAVMYAYSNGIMNGLDTNVFGPNETTTRAMLVTMLYRAVGEPAVSGTNTFRDVAANTWYTDAIIWASTNGIVNGVDDGLFNPNGAITREQLAAILYRYAKYVGDDVSASVSLAGFTDAGSISDYAKDAMSWAVAAGLFEGRDNGKLEPTGTATRAEIGTVFMRLFG